MKAIVYGVVVVVAVASVLATVYLTGLTVGRRSSYRAQLNRLGLDRRTAHRYAAAVRIMERLAGDRDVSGLMDGDALSHQTQSMVTSWVAAHRKETQAR